MRRLFCFALLPLLISSCATVPPVPPLSPGEAPLVAAMADRLAIAREVAWIKYQNGLPVRDPDREAAVLASVTALGVTRGLEPGEVREFFAAQIAASGTAQERWLYLWRRGAPLPIYPPRSLSREVRQDIDALDIRLIAALTTLGAPARDLRSRAEQALRRSGIDPRAARLAAAPLVDAPGG